eukprot:1275493-Amphidinium_carterae.1
MPMVFILLVGCTGKHIVRFSTSVLVLRQKKKGRLNKLRRASTLKSSCLIPNEGGSSGSRQAWWSRATNYPFQISNIFGGTGWGRR